MQLKRKSFYLFSFAAEVGAVMEEKTNTQKDPDENRVVNFCKQ